jgi:neurofibromin 1
MAMSHILKANIDAGLKHSLSMGYDEDQGTRAAFIQVLTNILNQGTEFDTLAEDVMTDRYEKLIDVS